MWGIESPMGLATKGVNTNMGHKALRQMPSDIRKEEPLCLTKWSPREGWHTGGLAEALLIRTPHQAGRKQRRGVGRGGCAWSSGLVVSFAELGADSFFFPLCLPQARRPCKGAALAPPLRAPGRQ